MSERCTSKLCAEGRHAWDADGWCRRRGCDATRTRDLFGRPLDASAGELFRDVEARDAGGDRVADEA